jgi:hypothetical protein
VNLIYRAVFILYGIFIFIFIIPQLIVAIARAFFAAKLAPIALVLDVGVIAAFAVASIAGASGTHAAKTCRAQSADHRSLLCLVALVAFTASPLCSLQYPMLCLVGCR